MIKIITACDHSKPYQELADLCKFSIKQYCRRNGLTYSFYKITETERPPAWYKIRFLKQEFERKETRYCLWMDADALIFNPDFDIRSLIKPGKQLYLSEDCHGINAGVMLWKNSRLNRRLLSRIWRSTRYLNHPWWEQKALTELVKADFQGVRERLETLPQKLFNAYDYGLYQKTHCRGQLDKNSFILHFPGLAHQVRKQQMEKYLHEAWRPTATRLALSKMIERFRGWNLSAKIHARTS